jgi:riboflavin synthase
MFTGIIQETGTLEKRATTPDGVRFAVVARDLSKRLKPGDSVAVNGVCQTVETAVGDTFTFTAVAETLRRTTLGSVDSAIAVNLERAATPETALGGHIVQGHVDGVGRVETFETIQRGDRPGMADRLLTIWLPAELASGVVEKGSIAIDGVSLTVAGVTGDGRVTIAIVPYTMEKTVVGNYMMGTPVNIETDILGKYVKQYLMSVYGGVENSAGGGHAPRGKAGGR